MDARSPDAATARLSTGDVVSIHKSVPTWGGRKGTVERVAFDGSCQVKLGLAAILWFDKWEVERDASS